MIWIWAVLLVIGLWVLGFFAARALRKPGPPDRRIGPRPFADGCRQRKRHGMGPMRDVGKERIVFGRVHTRNPRPHAAPQGLDALQGIRITGRSGAGDEMPALEEIGPRGLRARAIESGNRMAGHKESESWAQPGLSRLHHARLGTRDIG